ncbi:glucose-6-phosphate isomerase [Leptospira sp. 2 VSF19]|uniref:Glucose-6-phosphate isomerase n=1 Tax=Leptospira soteropolitanensis TaxID=2950025 RepID=A0AAW5VC29_9LEPT|nr:glucose-6-phosphate isomerase [Leptospira soteropolitanensis]MCW7491621.1 glucose-6-phosphate isomerase [Leptospira soteropolitanensis]MCW7499205.1 glucose-6-phosphate isomerase [Leptospira soteropolitanensis]MCW7521203.1 glucose-6-phosphate isomerase [Leptospira soteropolitanensis]MCW7525309.1 glucose-6-phosphate isomerase [Leptospira soteropolitanensis]MCW7529176.1 glucose-6-phosphate isomerase [Leptospira soteropolitanensis]
MSNVKISDRFVKSFISETLIQKELDNAEKARQTLLKKSGQGSEFLGWVDLPSKTNPDDLQMIRKAAETIQSHSQYLVVVGIGGSYLGARAVIEALTPEFSAHEIHKKSVKIIYAGHHLDADYHSRLLAFLENKEFSVNVISKSGTTTEPAIAFRLLLSLLERKYGRENVKNRVFATTDKEKGALKQLADEYQFQTFIIPDDVGGRFSVFTPVGLLPIAAAGFSINKLIDGAKTMEAELREKSASEGNIATIYAAIRNSLYGKGKKIEILVSYTPAFSYLSEWWKQLFGESEGKTGKGIFPASVQFTTDLHSMGQYIQDGERQLMETTIKVESPKQDVYLTEKADDRDGLNYLAGKKLSEVNQSAMLGTLIAHKDGGVPCLEIVLPTLTEETIGELLYFFEFACGVSGYMLGVNPFDQPGVEDYKNNMFALLGKKGYEKRKQEILSHI